MDLIIRLDGADGKTAAVYRALRTAIVDGRLPAGERLPPTRALAADLGVARGSVATAYERLVAEGYLEARVGAGTFVALKAINRTRRRHAADPIRPRDDWNFEPLATSGAARKPRYDFRSGIPDAQLFPFDAWRRLVTAELRLRANNPGTYGDPAGHPALREAVARYLGVSRGVRTTAADVVVTNGAQHAFDLIARVLVKPGDVVAVEEPGYPPARRILAALGAKVAGVRVDDEGLVVADLPAHCRLVHTTPSHQFPLGRAMSLARRRELLDWARARPAAIVEDDYDSEFRFSARPLEPLHSLDTAGRVLYVGTFSKSMLPALRTGFVLATPGLRDPLIAARQLGDGYGQPAIQAALARFLDEGLLARHVRRAGRAYGERHARIAAALAAMPGLDVLPSAAGLHVTALTGADSTAVVSAAARAGLAVDDLRAYSASTPAPTGFVFGFGATDPALLDEGMALFEALLKA
ncbi:GntR family transcriptional regulator [Paractinoplanes abujensis]|uniref:GntR family transcriptional regulator/MocR family aminotransferase n=1 Tax=Paractinoplanes abujensis TaxID=882441 RepID=A0A7W7CT77_9ACTN|nr:PLP-dependent aminotransferase family protein [Actinoplanes abujensis]MBB4694272.1 GntR family transcriptional regulator/MocR family aminotransferase [Actinoplanes abujensis]GID20515.1 GntR family transcriptional regulator [Actinoplanes abujensis]